MTRRFDMILFDLDGTLTDPGAAITRSMAYALGEVGVLPPPPDELTWCIGPPLRQNLAKLQGPDRSHLIEPAVGAYLRRYVSEGVRETVVYRGTAAMLNRVRSRGAALHVATAKLTEHAEEVLVAFSLRQYFDRVFGSQRDGALGDKVELLRFILDETAVPRDRAVMVGDREHDVNAGKANRLFTIGVTYGYGSREELERTGADAICDSLGELATVLL